MSITVDLRQLRHALALAEARNFQRAADALHLSQSALSRSIQALERSLGARLFDRGTKDVEPTELGRLVLAHATHVQGAARDLQRELALAQGLESGDLSVGAGPFGGAALLGPVAARLNRRHPKLRLRLIVAPWNELPDRLRSREIDLMVGDLRGTRGVDEFEVQKLCPHPSRVICRADHPLTKLASPTALDAFRYPLAGPPLAPGDVESVLRPLGAADRERLRRSGILTITCDSAPTLVRLVESSDTLSLLYLFLVADELRAGHLRVLPGFNVEPGPSFGVVRLRDRTLSLPAKAFLDELRQYDRELAELDRSLVKELGLPTGNVIQKRSVRRIRPANGPKDGPVTTTPT
jgi:DNA-binding transcriptional LysR family regulator